MAVISKDIKLSYKKDSTFVELLDLQEIPDLGGDTEAIDVTTLADAAFRYTDGLINYGDSLAFKFLYEKTQFTTLEALDKAVEWKVELPDGTSCTFTATSRVKLNGVGVNAALTYTLNLKPNSEMIWA